MAEPWSQMHESIKYHKDLTPRERIIFCDIRDLARNDAGLCYAGNRYLAERHGLKSVRTISRAIAKFVKLGLAVIVDMNHTNNTRYIQVIEVPKTQPENTKVENGIGGQKRHDVTTKMSKRLDKNVSTYRQNCLPLYNEEKNKRELQERRSGPEPPTPSQKHFFETFFDIPNNAPFDDAKHDMELLTLKIRASRFVYANAQISGSKWLIRRYAKIVADEYADFVLPPARAAPKTPSPGKSFMRHNYHPDTFKNIFANLDEVEF